MERRLLTMAVPLVFQEEGRSIDWRLQMPASLSQTSCRRLKHVRVHQKVGLAEHLAASSEQGLR